MDANNDIACPACGENILAVAKKCKHCNEWLHEIRQPSAVSTNSLPISDGATIPEMPQIGTGTLALLRQHGYQTASDVRAKWPELRLVPGVGYSRAALLIEWAWSRYETSIPAVDQEEEWRGFRNQIAVFTEQLQKVRSELSNKKAQELTSYASGGIIDEFLTMNGYVGIEVPCSSSTYRKYLRPRLVASLLESPFLRGKISNNSEAFWLASHLSTVPEYETSPDAVDTAFTPIQAVLKKAIQIDGLESIHFASMSDLSLFACTAYVFLLCD